MAKQAMILKVEDEDRDRWKVSAEKEGVTLSEWIRRKCNAAEVIPVAVVVRDGPGEETVRVAKEVMPNLYGREKSENPVAVAFRNMGSKKREKLEPEYSQICEHSMLKAGCPRCKMNAKR